MTAWMLQPGASRQSFKNTGLGIPNPRRLHTDYQVSIMGFVMVNVGA